MYSLQRFVCILLAVLQPRSLLAIGQLIPETYFYFPVAVPIIFYHVYITIAAACSVPIVGCGALLYCFYITIITSELRLGRRRYKSEGTLRMLRNTMHVFRCLQTFHANVMCLFGPYLVVFNATFMMSTIYVNFVLMRYWHELESVTKFVLLLLNFILVAFYLVVLELGCIFRVGGMKMLKSWNRVKWSRYEFENKEMKAFHRSCKPLLLCWGNLFVIGRESILVYGRGVIRGTFRALLTAK